MESLREGRFFTTTGEILITHFGVEVSPSKPSVVKARLRWTFPLRHAEMVGGDGERIMKHRIELTHTREHGDEVVTFALPPEFATASWLRLEVWDVATNGAFTQPVHRP